MAGTIQRTSDGVPIFDGSPELLTLYREEAVQYLMTFEYKKRYLAGPRLVKELQGTAKTAVRNMTLRNPQWVSHPRGVFVLLEHLEGVVAKPSLVEASRFIMKYFYGLQRKKFETMTSWITRHSEALWEASQSLRKVQKEYGPRTKAESSQGWHDHGPRSGVPSQTGSVSGDPGPFRDDGRLDEADDDEENFGNYGWWQGEHQDWRAQGHGNYGWSGWGYQSWHSKEYEPPESWDTSSEVFLPEFLVGFLLLHRSGLDTHERANVLAAIRGEFSPQTVAKALREQWSDDDLNKRDRAKFGAAMTAVGGEDEELEALMVDDDDHLQDLSHEDQQAYMLEQSRVDEALAAIQTQKTTLKEARWKQKQLKLGRGYFPPKPYQRPGPSGGSTKKPVGEGCFKCGGPHLARDCPKKMEKEARVSEEAAEIAFGVTRIQEDDNLYGSVVEETAMEAVEGEQVLKTCYGIIDSGATSSLGSIDALEEVMKANLATHGDSKMEIDLNQKPTFKFGNGQKKTCLSTVHMGMEAGSKSGRMEVHVHDSPMQPVLVSRKALKALGAVIDFEEGTIIYKRINKKKVVKLKEAANGHLLMPLTGNLLLGAEDRSQACESLREH